MRKDKFMNFLEEMDYSFSLLPDKRILIDHDEDVDFAEIESIPSDILFKNNGNVYMDFTSLPKNIEFENNGYVSLPEVLSVSSGLKFRNRGDVDLTSLKDIDKEIIFKNSGNITFDYLEYISDKIIFSNEGNVFLGNGIPMLSKGIRFENKGDIIVFNSQLNKDFFIEGIRKQKILNSMIEQTIG